MKNNKVILLLSSFWAFSVLALGVWWLYLLNKFTNVGEQDNLLPPERLSKLIIWEGGTFVILIFLLSGTLLFYYLKDQNKTKALQTFFAGLTHELKTPLASIRLQADVISDMAKDTQLEKLTHRMVEDTQKLEIQMDKILQLSRIEQGGDLNPTQIQIVNFLNPLIKEWSNHLDIDLNFPQEECHIYADEFALELILKNLFENTKNHTEEKKVSIDIERKQNATVLTYSDGGVFKGDPKKLSTLFYKYNSSKGSGIGLYLSKRLMEKMGGEIIISTNPQLLFKLVFKDEA